MKDSQTHTKYLYCWLVALFYRCLKKKDDVAGSAKEKMPKGDQSAQTRTKLSTVVLGGLCEKVGTCRQLVLWQGMGREVEAAMEVVVFVPKMLS